MSFPNEDDLTKQVEPVTWRRYLNIWRRKLQDESILRGQSCQKSRKISLRSSLERALASYNIPIVEAPKIEQWMIREFRRKYEGPDSQIVIDDTLYCLSLMEHYGCPTRLLDFTYSPYIAAFFAVENMSIEKGGEREAFVFCIKHSWINDSARKKIGDDKLFRRRFDDEIKEESFKPLYMEKGGSFIVAENPHRLHRKLSIQRGVFIIQGDISKSMMENLTSMDDWQNEKNVIIYKLEINTTKALKKVYEDLRLMNITHESLFPGLDGFAKSLKQNLCFYEDLKRVKTIANPYKEGTDA